MMPDDLPTLTLASASPRRRELLGLLGLPFTVQAANIPEVPATGEDPITYVRRVAGGKAEVVSRAQTTGLVLAADTEVVIEGQILGKPADATHATEMLTQLRGRTHEVISALVLRDAATGQTESAVCRSPVPMRNYSEAELSAYVASGDPFDKAGGYAIQHPGFHPVEGFAHCYASVMGLPLCHLTVALRRLGVEPRHNVPEACQSFNHYSCPIYQSVLADAAGEVTER